MATTDLLVDGKRQRDGDGYEPDGDYEHETDGRLHARFEGMNDYEVAINGYRR